MKGEPGMSQRGINTWMAPVRRTVQIALRLCVVAGVGGIAAGIRLGAKLPLALGVVLVVGGVLVYAVLSATSSEIAVTRYSSVGSRP